MKIKYLLMSITLLAISCNENSEIDETLFEENLSMAKTVENLQLSGTQIVGETVTFTSDVIIPEDIVLNFFEESMMIIETGVTVEINAKILAGDFQIFDVKDGATLNGCPQVEYIIPEWFGADDKGESDSRKEFQLAVESFPCIRRFLASGKYIFDFEVLLNVSDRDYDFHGSEFTGDSIADGFGGLITIGSREFQLNDSFSVENVSVYGGKFITSEETENALGVLHARNIQITNITIDALNGQRGVALQTPGPSDVTNPKIENIQISNIIQDGGLNVFNIDYSNGSVNNVQVSNIIGRNISNKSTRIQTLGKYEAAFRISGSADSPVENLLINNVSLENVGMGFNVGDANATITDVIIKDIDSIGINTFINERLIFNNVTMTGSNSELATAIFTVKEGTDNDILEFNGLNITGNFFRGIINNKKNAKYRDLNIDFDTDNYLIHNKGTAKSTFYQNVYLNGSGGNAGSDAALYNIASDCVFQDIFIDVATNSYAIRNGVATDSIQGNNCKFITVNVNNNTANQYSFGAINNNATNCVYSGSINGNFDYGLVNQGIENSFDFNIVGNFTNYALFTFSGSSKNFYEAIVNLDGNQTNVVNTSREGDEYIIYFLDPIANEYILVNP